MKENAKMCRGVEEGNHGHAHGRDGCRQSPVIQKGVVSAAGVVMCELCNSKASLYCQADDAYLCRKCDKWVMVQIS